MTIQLFETISNQQTCRVVGHTEDEMFLFAGDYESHWRLNSKGQVFGHTVFCKVRVEDEFCVPTQPKLITPKCEMPVVGFSQADGISLLLRANEVRS